MKLTDFVHDVPDDVWAVFEPILPPVVWQSVGRKPKSNPQCLHALLYLLITGIAWEFMPPGFPSYKTVQRRLKRWLALNCFHTAWQQLAQR
jgi:transposase